MPENVPDRIASDGQFAAAWNRNAEAIRSRQPGFVHGLGLRTHHTVHGTLHEPEPIITPYAQPSETVTPVVLKFATLFAIAGDTLTCVLADQTQVTAYKPSKLRASIVSENLDGIVVTYSNIAPQTRDAAINGQFVETQIILPRYTVGDVLFLVQPDRVTAGQASEGGVWIDLNVDARAWARKYV